MKNKTEAPRPSSPWEPHCLSRFICSPSDVGWECGWILKVIGKSEHFVLTSALMFFRPLFSEWKEEEGSGRKAEYCPVETATHYLAVFFSGNPSSLEGMDLKVKSLPLSSIQVLFTNSKLLLPAAYFIKWIQFRMLWEYTYFPFL